MKTPVKAVMPVIALNADSSTPLQRQVYCALRRIIVSGRLKRGVLLPSSRGLAAKLRVSRNTVLFAYEELAAAGLLSARRGCGTSVGRAVETIQVLDPDGHRLHCSGLQGSGS